MKVSAKLAKAFANYNLKAKEHQVKPISEARLPLFALLETLTKSVKLSDYPEFNEFSDEFRSMSSDRFKTCVALESDGLAWLTCVDVMDYCETRSANPRYENTLREAISSYYLLMLNTRSFIVVPDKRNSQCAFIVRTK